MQNMQSNDAFVIDIEMNATFISQASNQADICYQSARIFRTLLIDIGTESNIVTASLRMSMIPTYMYINQ